MKFQMAGDSGRSGGRISTRPRRNLDAAWLDEIQESPSDRVLDDRFELY